MTHGAAPTPWRNRCVAFQATYGQRMMSAMGGFMELAQSCATDKDFQAASNEFGRAMGN